MIKFRKILGGAAILSAVLFGFAACSNSSGSDDNNGGYGYDSGSNETVVQVKDAAIHTEAEKKKFIEENFNVSNENEYYSSGSVEYYAENDYLKIPVIAYNFSSGYSTSYNLKFELGDSSFKVYLYGYGDSYYSNGEWKTFDYKDIILADEMQACFGGNGIIPLFAGSDVKSFFVKEEYTSSYPSYTMDENGYHEYYKTKFKYLCFAVKTDSSGNKYVYTAETDEFTAETKFAVKKCVIQEGKELNRYGNVSNVICSKEYEYNSYSFDLNKLYKWNVTDNSSIITDQTYLDGTYTYESEDWYDYNSYSRKTAKCTVTLNNGTIVMTSNDSSHVSGFTGTYTIFGSKITIKTDSYEGSFTYSIESSKLKFSSNSYSSLLDYKFKSSSSYSLEMTKTSSSSGSGNGGSGGSVDSSKIEGYTWKYEYRNTTQEAVFSNGTVSVQAVTGSYTSRAREGSYSINGDKMTISYSSLSAEFTVEVDDDSLTLDGGADTDYSAMQVLGTLFQNANGSSSMTFTK